MKTRELYNVERKLSFAPDWGNAVLGECGWKKLLQWNRINGTCKTYEVLGICRIHKDHWSENYLLCVSVWWEGLCKRRITATKGKQVIYKTLVQTEREQKWVEPALCIIYLIQKPKRNSPRNNKKLADTEIQLQMGLNSIVNHSIIKQNKITWNMAKRLSNFRLHTKSLYFRIDCRSNPVI